jgi:hypothetical protein
MHLACPHPAGGCREKAVTVEEQLGILSRLCQTCAGRWGFEPTTQGEPLTAAELVELESKAGVIGLSTVDVRRLLANNVRLRRLALDAYLAIAERHSDFPRDVLAKLKAEVDRA